MLEGEAMSAVSVEQGVQTLNNGKLPLGTTRATPGMAGWLRKFFRAI
jgi:hypothetical protein